MRLRRYLSLAFGGALALVAATAPLPAFAAAQPAVAGLSRLDVQVWPQSSGTPVLIVVGTVPTATPLPVTVRLPLPKGVKVTWAGELDPTGSGNDTQLKPVTTAGTGGDVVEVVATKSREIQYEADLPAPRVASGRSVLSFDWVQSAPSDTVQFAFKTPAGVSDVKTKPAFKGVPDQNTQGEHLYVAPAVAMSPGSAQPVSIDFLPKAASSQTLPGVASSDPTMPILLGLLALALAGLAVVVISQRRKDDAAREEAGAGDRPAAEDAERREGSEAEEA